MSNSSTQVQEICRSFELDDTQLREMMAKLELEFKKGLDPLTASTASVKMLPTYIRAIAVGMERGDFLALDLGGTDFRVLFISLEGSCHSQMQSKIYSMPDDIQKGTGTALFDHVADCLSKFMNEHKLLNRSKLPLGFTFSFPCQQNGLNSATLTNWTKGFNASGVVGKDVVKLLSEAITRHGGMNIEVVAVLNDTTGTMLACSFIEKHCYIGVIVGRGCNAAYLEKLENVPKLRGVIKPEEDGLPSDICVNTEWGGFGDDGALEPYLTVYDHQLDKMSINPGHRRFEKTMSSMYMGELVRLVLEDLTKRGLMFAGDLSKIPKPGSFSTKLLSDIERQTQNVDNETNVTKVGEMLQDIGILNSTPTDCANVAYICSLVSKRSAHFCAVGIAALLKRVGRPYVTVGIDGSVFRFHPTFKLLLSQKIGELVKGQEFFLVLSEDGSGRGAAVAAAVSSRMNRN